MTKLLQNYKHLVWIMVIMCHITVDLGNKACHTILECRLISLNMSAEGYWAP